MIRCHSAGPHAHLSPLGHPALASVREEAGIVLTGDPGAADCLVFAHVLDLANLSEPAVREWRRRKIPVILLSEEPFWDTIWTGDPLERDLVRETRFGALPLVQLNHATSNLFHFEAIPYFLLTHPRYLAAYAERFARNARRSAADWQAEFADRVLAASFMFERREGAQHDVRWPQADLYGLCAWRTRLARAATGPVERLGRSWGTGPSRFELGDWHADKLAQLDGRARMIAAVENTHHPDYITEKLFDAFACGAVPLYAASPAHRVHDLGLPPESWLNLWDLSPAEAAERVAAFRPSRQSCEAFRAAQDSLRVRFSDPALVEAERARLATALRHGLQAVLDRHPG